MAESNGRLTENKDSADSLPPAEGKGTGGKLTPKEALIRDRLSILKNVLYGAGIATVGLSITVIILGVQMKNVDSHALTVLSTTLGFIVTTIIGVIAGTSIDK